MRLINFLNEGAIGDALKTPWENVDFGIDDLLDKCRPYMNDLKKQRGKEPFLLWSGRGSTSMVIERKVRRNRRPVDTPKELHNFIDSVFEKEFGVRARSNSLFCYNNWGLTEQYGHAFAIFPIGKYKILYSREVGDLYDKFHIIDMHYMTYLKYKDNPKMFKYIWEPMVDKKKAEFDYDMDKWIEYMKSDKAKKNLYNEMKKVINRYKFIDASGLPKVGERNELMLICDKYIGVHKQFYINKLRWRLYDFLEGR